MEWITSKRRDDKSSSEKVSAITGKNNFKQGKKCFFISWISIFTSKLINFFKGKLNDKQKKLLMQIFKFIIIGGIATIIDWIIYYLLYNLPHHLL